MNKEPKTLPQAIKIIVGIYGKDVVNDVRMVNIMNDVVSLEESNAVKSILRDCIRLGYGNKILTIASKEDYHLKIKRYSKDISDSQGYKNVIVQYILYSIAFGVGICPKEPYLKNQEVRQPEKKVGMVQEDNSEEEVEEERKIPYKFIAACVAILVVAVIYGYNSYSSSAAEKEQYEKNIFSGNSFMSSGDYENAIGSFKEAFNTSNYKKEALSKIDEMTDKLIKEGDSDNKSLLQAQKVIQSELQLNLNENEKARLNTKLENLESTINSRTENGRNTLITIISANNGKLDDNGRRLLDDLLELSPNDYWLNFIKEKSYE